MISSTSRPGERRCSGELPLDFDDELGTDLKRREVGRYLDLLGPLGELRADCAQHPAPDRDDQPGLLGDRDELIGRHQSALGVSPAQQRLEPDHALVAQLDQWLVVQLELVALDGVAQVALDRHPLDQAAAQSDVERLEAPTAELLGAVHRSVRVAQQLIGSFAAVLADSHANAGA